MKTYLSCCLLVITVLTVAGCHESPSSAPAAVEIAQAQIVESRQQQVPMSLHSTGTLHARETAVVSAQVMSRILQVLVHAADTVRAGQTLIVIDDAALRASYEQAQASVKAAEGAQAAAQTNAALAASTLNRYKQLESQKSVSPQEMDEVSRRAEAAAASLEAARAQTGVARAQESGARAIMSYARLSAPFAGVVTARSADPGTMASPGMPLLQIDRAGALQLDAPVDESAIAAIHKGMRVDVAVDGGASGSIEGTVTEIVPAADPASHSFLVKVDLPLMNRLRAGIYATAEFANGFRPAIVIPRSAVVVRGSLTCAYVLDAQGLAQLRSLTLGAGQGNSVEVLSGVSSGEKLVDAPADRDLAGKRIVALQAGVQP
jgi:RND family efflux transporter MFP subunit